MHVVYMRADMASGMTDLFPFSSLLLSFLLPSFNPFWRRKEGRGCGLTRAQCALDFFCCCYSCSLLTRTLCAMRGRTGYITDTHTHTSQQELIQIVPCLFLLTIVESQLYPCRTQAMVRYRGLKKQNKWADFDSLTANRCYPWT